MFQASRDGAPATFRDGRTWMDPAGSSPSEKETWNIVQHVAVPQVTEMIVADFCLRHWVVRAEALGEYQMAGSATLGAWRGQVYTLTPPWPYVLTVLHFSQLWNGQDNSNTGLVGG